VRRGGDRWTHPWIAIGLLLVLFAGGCGGCASQKSGEVDHPPGQVEQGRLIEQLRAPSDLRKTYQPPTTEQYVRLTTLLTDFYADLLEGVTDFDRFRDPFRRAGLRLQTVERGDQTWVILFEGGSTWRGTGVYAFRTGTDRREVVLQAPHSYYDIHTGEITETIFRQTDARAFFFNTLHRYRGATRLLAGNETHPSDLSHDTTSYFQAILTEYLTHRPNALVVQLHGYDRDSLRDRRIGLVLSDGSDDPADHVHSVGGRLEGTVDDWKVAIYGEGTDDYGATANAQGQWIRRFDHGRFLHVEMLREVRDRLEAGGPELEAVGDAIVGSDE
jgi:hypothetical protein